MDISGKTVLVTGGGSGIGEGIALALAREGCRVAITGRNEMKLQRVAAAFTGEPAILYRACDVGERADVEQLFVWLDQQQLAPLDILVISAGVNTPKRQFSELDPADWDRLLRINATGAFNCIQAALPGMRKRQNGLIVNISSIAGKRAAKLAGAAYAASKFAATALGTAVSLEERANGIHVTNIYPGEVNTPILKQRPTPVPPERLAQMLLPEDIANLVVTVAKLPARAGVPESVITPLYPA